MGVTVGIDLVDVSRIAARAGHATFLDRAFTPAEQQWCAADPSRLAGRWAAKEAAMKALGRGLGEVPMTDLEVLAEPSGAPTLRLSGTAAAAAGAAGWTAWSVSISHDGGYATAVVVALVGEPGADRVTPARTRRSVHAPARTWPTACLSAAAPAPRRSPHLRRRPAAGR